MKSFSKMLLFSATLNFFSSMLLFDDYFSSMLLNSLCFYSEKKTSQWILGPSVKVKLKYFLFRSFDFLTGLMFERYVYIFWSTDIEGGICSRIFKINEAWVLIPWKTILCYIKKNTRTWLSVRNCLILKIQKLSQTILVCNVVWEKQYTDSWNCLFSKFYMLKLKVLVSTKILVIMFRHFLIILLRSESPQVKRYLISSITNLVHELPNDLRLRILGIYEILEKCQMWV